MHLAEGPDHMVMPISKNGGNAQRIRPTCARLAAVISIILLAQLPGNGRGKENYYLQGILVLKPPKSWAYRQKLVPELLKELEDEVLEHKLSFFVDFF